jgi:hypothetical protein
VDDNSKGAETEVVVSVLAEESDTPWYGGVLALGFIVSGSLLPFYGGPSSVGLFYSIYDRTGALTKRYQYRIAYNEFVWFFVLPFSWINFFTYSLEDAVRSTTAQFVVDAQGDGYLGTEE